MIYWDNNATTPIAREVLDAMLPYLEDQYANPSSGYAFAKSARKAVEDARGHVAALAGAAPGEIIFTSGATESINTVLSGMRRMNEGLPVVCLATDHSATLHALGGDALACPVDGQGLANMDQWDKLCPDSVSGASFAWGNNETGVIQPAAELVESAHRHGLPVHADAVQCLGKMPVDVHDLGVEYASFSAHKLHGPKGVGALYVKSGVRLPMLILGGDQEGGRRGGTENVPGIVGFGEAARLALSNLDKNIREMTARRDFFETSLASALSGVTVLSSERDRLPNTSNIMFDGCMAEALSLLLESSGLLCSAGSACKTASPGPSHVLMSMGLSDNQARSCLRFSMGAMTTGEEAEEGVRLVIDAVNRVRRVQSSRTGPVTIYTV